MPSTEPPAIARRRLRLALRRLREDKGVTQAQVADALDWSLSKVNRIESGDVTISSSDLRSLLGLLDVTDDGLIERLVDDARAARRRGWWDDARYRERLNPATRQLLQYEGDARTIRCFNPTVVPGILQTHDYARAIVNFLHGESPEADRDVRVEVRLRRSEHVFDRPDLPEYHLILDESVILRDVGGPRVMVQQLERLMDLIHRKVVTARLVPLGEPATSGMVGPFTILELEGSGEGAVLYRETVTQDEIVEVTKEVVRHRQIFDDLWRHSLGEDASVRRIAARAAVLLASLDHVGPDRPARGHPLDI